MQHFTALIVAIIANLVDLSVAVTLRDGSRDQKQTTEDVSLLSIMRKLQHQRPISMVANEVKLQRPETEQSMKERQLLTDMGHLEDQLETWKSSQYKMQGQMSAQASELARLKAEHLQAVRDEQHAEAIWRYVKMLMSLITLLGLVFCVYITRSRPQTKLNSPCLADARDESWLPPVVEAVPKPVIAVASVQEPFEDTFQATMSLPHPTLAENPDIEAPNAPEQAEDVWNGDLSIISPRSSPNHAARQESEENTTEPKCEYFSLVEDAPVGSHGASAEEDWWNEPTSGY
jgi:hypothetical protein